MTMWKLQGYLIVLEETGSNERSDLLLFLYSVWLTLSYF